MLYQSHMIRHVEGRVDLRVDGAVSRQGIRDLVYLPEILRALPGKRSRHAARETVWRWQPSWLGGRRLVVRQYVHGGLLRSLRGVTFLSRRPMLNELRVNQEALQGGVPTCRPIAVRIEHTFGPLLRAHYITEEIPEAVNLLDFCEMESPAAVRIGLAHAVAGALVALHQADIRHGDLNLKNILVRSQNERMEAFVIDFKKARIQANITPDEALAALARLDRSIVKWPASRRAISVSDRLRTLRDYIRAVQGSDLDWKPIACYILTGPGTRAARGA